MSNRERVPKRDWVSIKDQVAEDAKTMTNRELSVKYEINRYAMRKALDRLGVTPRKSEGIDWIAKLKELEALAKVKTTQELADHFGCTVSAMYSVCRSHDIRPQPAPRPRLLAGKEEELKTQAQRMSAIELAAHFGVSLQCMRENLKELGIKPAADKFFKWPGRIDEIKRLIAEGLTSEELAKHYGCKPSVMRNAIGRLGIKIPRTYKRKEKKEVAAPSYQAAQKTPFNHRPAPVTSTVSIKAAKVVVPRDVKVTKVATTPSPYDRVCNGSSTETYSPSRHGGATTAYRR